MFKYLALCLALVASTSIAQANNLAINVGNTNLLPNTDNQKVYINVTGGDNVTSLTFECQIEDGGQAIGGGITGPTITDLDVLTGTIFANNNNGQTPGLGGYLFPQLFTRGTITDPDNISPTVKAEGLLATITISTVGFGDAYIGHSFSLIIKDTLNGTYQENHGNGTTHFDEDVIPAITNGTITITATVPEPATGLLLVAGAGLLLRRRIHRTVG